MVTYKWSQNPRRYVGYSMPDNLSRQRLPVIPQYGLLVTIRGVRRMCESIGVYLLLRMSETFCRDRCREQKQTKAHGNERRVVGQEMAKQ